MCRLIPSEPANSHVIIYAHGNASDLFDSVGMMENIAAKLNMELVVFDYTGYGCSRAEGEEKTEISEKSIRGDLEVVLGWVTKNKKLSEIILWGFSLGTYPRVLLRFKVRNPSHHPAIALRLSRPHVLKHLSDSTNKNKGRLPGKHKLHPQNKQHAIF